MRIRSIAAIPAALAVAFAPVLSGHEASAATRTGPSIPRAVVASPGHGPVEPPAPSTGERRIDLEMKDIEFAPVSVDVKFGETITFVFTNTGELVHDAFIGDKAAQEQHEQEMQEMRESGGSHDHAHEGGVTVPPGQKGALRYHFDQLGTLEIGCHEPRHYEKGMKVVINVNPI